ncbi:lipopolysaccharide biosynthesis protein [uncultured Bacteroides sp.]|uniref:lipopolysaccharide biosynthesis protein n=1 Tax=uncultured Bacteroides sp. TaxID=162156 RepID=UPI0026658159|nr:hypothetical protein [uncultured Bacteroides sp.]
MMKININSPIRKNIVANLFGIGVNLLNQIVLVPFYIIYWGNDLYSDWIVISALTAFFGMSDIGLNSVIQNRFSIKYAQNEIQECNSLLTNNFFVVCIIGTICLLLGIGYVSIFDISQNIGLTTLSRSEGSIIFLMLLCQVFIQMFSSIENAIYRAKHKANIAVYYDQIAKLLIVLITFICLLLGVSLAVMSILICVPNLLLFFVKHINARKLYNFSFSVKLLDWSLLREIIRPSVMFLSFPLANAIILQGFTLVINKYFNADSVVLYNTTRTMCNFIKSFLNTIFFSVWPEFSIAYGKNNKRKMNDLVRKAVKSSISIALLICVGLLLFGPFIYKIWTQDHVAFSYALMISFVVELMCNVLWNIKSVALVSTNNHTQLGLLFVGGAILSLITAIPVASTLHSMPAITYSLLMMDIPLIIYVNHKVNQLLTNLN